MVKKIGIATVYTGFNFGSSLQAYASKEYLKGLGYEAEILGHKGGLVKGRDIRLGKLFTMFYRTVTRPALMKKTFLTYKSSLTKDISEEAKCEFLNFEIEKIQPYKDTWRNLKRYAKDEDVFACFCGSDQIWNATNIYIDPLFYLKFAPKYKRIAYAPSFGKNEIPEYNKGIIKKNLKEINYISVREEQGVKIIKNLIGKDVNSVIDPTLLLNKEQWISKLTKKVEVPRKYILAYFLDKPTEVAINYIKLISQKLSIPIIAIHYKYDELLSLSNVEYRNVGPEQFINLINDATFVCTDSFHGTAFSVNFNTPFYIFKRNYGTATDQSSRIISLLEKLSLRERYISKIDEDKLNEVKIQVDFVQVNNLLEKEREKSANYLFNAFSCIKDYNR